jgi:hypothetical protein
LVPRAFSEGEKKSLACLIKDYYRNYWKKKINNKIDDRHMLHFSPWQQFHYVYESGIIIRGPLAGLFQVLLHWLLQKPCQTPNKKRLPS